MLKESKFTYKTSDGDGGILLYNTMTGVNSFLHIPRKAVALYEACIYGNFELLSKAQLEELVDLGIFVPENKNEDFELKQKYIDIIGENTLTLIINPTEKCNFKCRYCYETFENGRMNEQTIQGIIRYVEKNIHKFRKLYVMWFGGEPLLEIDVIERLSHAFIEICKKYGKIYISDITSNGYLLDFNTFERLVQNKILTYQITIDGYKDTHDSQRIGLFGEPTYDIIMNNIQAILNNRKYKRFMMTIRVNVSKELYDNLDKFIDEYNSLFGKDNRVFIDIHLVGNWLGKTEDGFICKLLGENEIREIYKKILYYPTPLHNISHAFLNPGGRVCYSGRRNTLMFSSNGAIHKCTLLFNTPGSQLGNITDNGEIKDYDYSGAQKWLCYDENCKNIKECFYSPICFGDSCPSAHSGMYQYEKAVTGCPHEKNNLDLLLKILHRDRPFKIWEDCIHE